MVLMDYLQPHLLIMNLIHIHTHKMNKMKDIHETTTAPNYTLSTHHYTHLHCPSVFRNDRHPACSAPPWA